MLPTSICAYGSVVEEMMMFTCSIPIITLDESSTTCWSQTKCWDIYIFGRLLFCTPLIFSSHRPNPCDEINHPVGRDGTWTGTIIRAVLLYQGLYGGNRRCMWCSDVAQEELCVFRRRYRYCDNVATLTLLVRSLRWTEMIRDTAWTRTMQISNDFDIMIRHSIDDGEENARAALTSSYCSCPLPNWPHSTTADVLGAATFA